MNCRNNFETVEVGSRELFHLLNKLKKDFETSCASSEFTRVMKNNVTTFFIQTCTSIARRHNAFHGFSVDRTSHEEGRRYLSIAIFNFLLIKEPACNDPHPNDNFLL